MITRIISALLAFWRRWFAHSHVPRRVVTDTIQDAHARVRVEFLGSERARRIAMGWYGPSPWYSRMAPAAARERRERRRNRPQGWTP